MEYGFSSPYSGPSVAYPNEEWPNLTGFYHRSEQDIIDAILQADEQQLSQSSEICESESEMVTDQGAVASLCEQLYLRSRSDASLTNNLVTSSRGVNVASFDTMHETGMYPSYINVSRHDPFSLPTGPFEATRFRPDSIDSSLTVSMMNVTNYMDNVSEESIPQSSPPEQFTMSPGARATQWGHYSDIASVPDSRYRGITASSPAYSSSSNTSAVAEPTTRYTCQVENCKRKTPFTRKADLNRHMLIHREERSFSCFIDGCNRFGPNAFRRRDNLIEHQKRVHSR